MPHPTSHDAGRGKARRRRAAGAAALFAVALVVAAINANVHDYRSFYLPGWSAVLDGGDPWSATGGGAFTYGPLFAALAIVKPLHASAPKLLFVACWFATAWWFQRRAEADPRFSGRARTRFWAYLFLTPFFWIETVHYGHFDIIPAACMVGAVVAAGTGGSGRAGALVAVGFSWKFYPVVVVPAIARRGRGFDWRLLGAAAAVVAAIWGMAYLVWGPAVFTPLLRAGEQPSRHLSVFRFLRGSLMPTPDLDHLGTPVTALALVVAALAGWRLKLPPSVHAVLMTLALLMFFPNGNAHYRMTLFMLAPLVLLDQFEAVAASRRLRIRALVYGAWVVAYSATYYLTLDFHEPNVRWMQDIGGGVSLVLASLVIHAIVTTPWRAAPSGSSAESRAV